MQEFEYENNLIKKEDETMKEFITNKDSNLSNLHILLDEIQKKDCEYEELLKANNAKTDKRLEKLTSDLEEYDINHAQEKEEQKILNSRNLVLRLKKGQIDKAIEEASNSISALEKECFEKINISEQELKSLEKEATSKLSEAERKAKNSVKKVNDSILAPKIKDDNEIVDLISATQEDLYNKFLKDEEKIYSLRIEGIEEVAKIKRDFYELKYNTELELLKKRIDLKKNIELVKNYEDEEIANLRHIIKVEESRFRDEEYFTNHNVMINISGVNYKNELTRIKMMKTAYEEVKDLYQLVDRENKNLYDGRCKIVNLVYKSEKEFVSELNRSFEVINKQLDNKFSSLEKDDLNILVDNIKKLASECILDINNLLTESIKYLIINDLHIDYLDGYDYANHLERLNTLTDSKLKHFDRENDCLLKHIDHLSNNTIDANSCSNVLANFKDKVKKTFAGFISEFSDEIENTYSEVKNYIEEERHNYLFALSEDANAHNEWYLAKTNEIKNLKKEAKNKYTSAIDNLKFEKFEYANTYSKKALEEINVFKANMKVIKAQPRKINKKYQGLLKENIRRINKEYKSSLKKVRLEEKERKLMCKKN